MRYYELTELSNRERKEKAGTEKDQFFTRPEVAENFASWVKKTLSGLEPKPTTWIEPSAGNGDLARHFPGIQMYDLDPQREDIKQADFLKSDHKYEPGKTFVMNPPFGKASDLAIMFFNKAAQAADHIAQIVPRTFKRDSVLNRLEPKFRLVDQYDLPRNSFYLPFEGDGKTKGYDVNAVAQVFTRMKEGEETETDLDIKNFQFLMRVLFKINKPTSIGSPGLINEVITKQKEKFKSVFNKNYEILIFAKFEFGKNVELIDLVKPFPTSTWSRKSASIQRRTDRQKFEIEKRVSS